MSSVKLLAIGLNERCGVSGSDGYRAVWDLRQLAASSQIGLPHQSLYDRIVSIVYMRGYVAVAYDAAEWSSVVSYEQIFKTQLAGAVLAATSRRRCKSIEVNPRSVRKFAAGDRFADEESLRLAAKRDCEKSVHPAIVMAYWSMRFAQREFLESITME